MMFLIFFYIKFYSFRFNKFAIKEAAENNDVVTIYYLLMKETIIDEELFMNLNKLTKVAIPPSITSICPYAFYECESLNQISLPSSITSIKHHSFYG